MPLSTEFWSFSKSVEETAQMRSGSDEPFNPKSLNTNCAWSTCSESAKRSTPLAIPHSPFKIRCKWTFSPIASLIDSIGCITPVERSIGSTITSIVVGYKKVFNKSGSSCPFSFRGIFWRIIPNASNCLKTALKGARKLSGKRIWFFPS